MALKAQLELAQEKLDKVAEDIAEIKNVQVAQAADLKHHIYRTDLAEQHLRKLEEEFKPVQKHVALVNAGLKIVGAITTFFGLIIGFAKVILELF